MMCEATVKTTCATSPRIVAKIWNIENSPVKVHSSFSAKLLVIVNFSVKSAKALTILYSPSGEAFMNTLRKAVPTWPSTLTTAQKMLSSDRRISSRPPRATKPLRKSFRASDMALITPPTQLPTAVNSCCAWLKSPIRIRQVSAHPEPSASFQVPTI